MFHRFATGRLNLQVLSRRESGWPTTPTAPSWRSSGWPGGWPCCGADRLSLNEASDKLGWSRGRLDRYERNEWRLPDASHVRDLARIYEASDEEREELEDLGRQARSGSGGGTTRTSSARAMSSRV